MAVNVSTFLSILNVFSILLCVCISVGLLMCMNACVKRGWHCL